MTSVYSKLAWFLRSLHICLCGGQNRSQQVYATSEQHALAVHRHTHTRSAILSSHSLIHIFTQTSIHPPRDVCMHPHAILFVFKPSHRAIECFSSDGFHAWFVCAALTCNCHCPSNISTLENSGNLICLMPFQSFNQNGKAGIRDAQL